MSLSSSSQSRFWTALFIVGLLSGLVFLVIGLMFGSNIDELSETVRRKFEQPMQETLGVELLRPVTVSIYERPSVVRRQAENYDNDAYSERLIIVRPYNWIVYTSNGITFHYLTRNVSASRSRCVTPNALNAVAYRLRTRGESNDSSSDRIRFSCVEYTFDQLVRIFSRSNRTDLDLTDYFDKEKNTNAQSLTITSILQFLVYNAYV